MFYSFPIFAMPLASVTPKQIAPQDVFGKDETSAKNSAFSSVSPKLTLFFYSNVLRSDTLSVTRRMISSGVMSSSPMGNIEEV